MKRKWALSIALAGCISLFAVPLASLAAPASGERANPKAFPKAFELQLGSGGIAVPGFAAPKDGIISGSGGCVPDVHEYTKSVAKEHIVFSASVNSPTLNKNTDKTMLKNHEVVVIAEIYSGGSKILELPLWNHPPDPNTGKDFLVACLYINEDEENPDAYDMATGSYTYKFVAKHMNKNNQVSNFVTEWVPDDNTFTISD